MAKPTKRRMQKRKPSTRRSKRARKPSAVGRHRGRRQAEPRSDVLTKVDADAPENGAVSRARPSWWRYFQACLLLLDRGVPPTLVNIAKELGVTRQAVWALQRRHPGLLAWINTEFIARNKEFFGPVQYRLAMLGMQGHVAAADLYLKSLTMGFGTLDAAESVPAGIQVIQNYLVPRPAYPQLEAPAKALPPPMHADIPTVVVR